MPVAGSPSPQGTGTGLEAPTLKLQTSPGRAEKRVLTSVLVNKKPAFQVDEEEVLDGPRLWTVSVRSIVKGMPTSPE